MMSDKLIYGSIDVEKDEIKVKENIGGGEEYVKVNNKKKKKKVKVKMESERVEKRKKKVKKKVERKNVKSIDVVVSEKKKILVSGRGIDKEIGGRVRIKGKIKKIRKVGYLDLIRGSIRIIGKRIKLDEGNVKMVGDINKKINLVERQEGEGIKEIVNVKGKVEDIKIVLQ